jgi:hypothetical protein
MTGKSPRIVDVTIRIDKNAAERLDAIVGSLAASGLTNIDLHKRFLIVNGSVDVDDLDALRAVDGVASVRQDQTYKAQSSSTTQ